MNIDELAINMNNGIEDSDETSKGLWLSYLGGAVTLVSIPLFISAGKHKKKLKFNYKMEQLGLIMNLSIQVFLFHLRFSNVLFRIRNHLAAFI